VTQHFMGRLAAFVARRRALVLAVWAALLVAAVPLAMRQNEDLTAGGGLVPGSQSQRVDAAIERFPEARYGQQGVLLKAAPDAAPGALRAAEERVRRAAPAIDDVEVQRRPPPGSLPPDTAFVPLLLKGGESRRIDAAIELREELDVDAGPQAGVTAYLVGPESLWSRVNELSKEQLVEAETIGFPVTLAILLLAFGALAAALLPIALAAVTLTLTGAVVFLLALRFDMSIFVTNVASMVGIAVAIDYSLFVLARFREEVAAGASEDDALRRALQSSGTAVVFSGLTVVVSLAAIFVVDSTVLRSMALGMIVVVAFSILGAVTLVPALVARFGRRAYAPGRWTTAVKRRAAALATRALRRRSGTGEADFWTRWTERVTRRPGRSAVAAAALMLALALPALDMQLGQGALHQLPPGDETRDGLELAAELAPPGRRGPIQEHVVFRAGGAASPANARALDRHLAVLRARPEVAEVDPPARSPDPREVLLTIVPRAGAETPESRALLRELRAGVARGEGLAAVADVSVGGATAIPLDFQDQVAGAMPEIALLIVALSYVILVFVLRSLVLPLKAVGMTLLSVVAAYGVLVVLYQWGWADGLFGHESPGHVEAVALPLVLTIVFGLSMDYEVFLLARIREALRPGVDTRAAIAQGLRRSAGTISSAALIMVSVFAVFASVGLPTIKQFGTGLAVAILLDATIVRLVLVPATMELLGRWNWWLPRPLERRLPASAFESPAPAGAAAGD
jgi:uncharacterized membrane protein YdfJ with MMPL/SSD domain